MSWTPAVGCAGFVKGNHDAKRVTATLNDSHKTLLACYTKALADNAALAGSVVAQFTIGSDGKVTVTDMVGDPLAGGLGDRESRTATLLLEVLEPELGT